MSKIIRTRFLLFISFMLIGVMAAVMGVMSLSRLAEIAKPIRTEIPGLLETVSNASQLDILSQHIRYYGEVLTQSARNYAMTRDARWRERYGDAEPKLEKAIQAALAKGDEDDKKFFADIEASNTALVEMDYEAIGLAEKGDSLRAMNILEGKPYAVQKHFYEQGLKDYVGKRGMEYDESVAVSYDALSAMTKKVNDLISESIKKTLFLVVFSIVLIILTGFFTTRYVSIEIARRHKSEKDLEDLSKFPLEDPSPVMRVSANGAILFSNEACRRWITTFGTRPGDYISETLRATVTAALSSVETKEIESEEGERFFQFTIVPIRKGNYVNLYGMDITDRKNALDSLGRQKEELAKLNDVITGINNELQAEQQRLFDMNEELRRSADRYAIAEEAAGIGIWDWNIRTGSIHFSERIAHIFGFKKGEFGGTYKDFMNRVHPEDRQRVIDELNDCVKGSQGCDTEHRIVWPNGTVRWVSEKGKIFQNYKDGKPVRMLAVVQDITKQKQDAEEIKEAAEIRSKFATIASHEIRNPLATLKDSVDLILSGTLGDLNESQNRMLDTAMKSINRMINLTTDILDFQKLITGKMQFNMKENSVNETIEEIYRTEHFLVEQRGLYFTLNLADNLPRVRFDKDKIIQVLVNLVNNALKFTEEGGITITTEKDDNIIRVTIRDTGPGIGEEDMPKLFQTFEQFGGGPVKKEKGTGLGLSICKEIIQGHGGKIWAESKPGEGSSFIFVLPVVERRVV
ncbi:MAG: PAS domain-containing sensor histidine kinase [Candidatus Omnitrophota bacterium]